MKGVLFQNIFFAIILQATLGSFTEKADILKAQNSYWKFLANPESDSSHKLKAIFTGYLGTDPKSDSTVGLIKELFEANLGSLITLGPLQSEENLEKARENLLDS